MTDAAHFGCACCSPRLMPTVDHASSAWRDLIEALPRRAPADGADAVIFHGGAIYPDPADPGRRVEARDAAAAVGVEVLNASERLNVGQALRAVTIDAAWQCHLDDQIGSLLPGKQADLVILDQDPLTWQAIDAVGMRDIAERETWVSGKRVHPVA